MNALVNLLLNVLSSKYENDLISYFYGIINDRRISKFKETLHHTEWSVVENRHVKNEAYKLFKKKISYDL